MTQASGGGEWPWPFYSELPVDPIQAELFREAARRYWAALVSDDVKRIEQFQALYRGVLPMAMIQAAWVPEPHWPGDAEMLERAVRSVGDPGRGRGGRPRWAMVADRLAVGATLAMALCRRFGLDPDEQLRASKIR